jgi:SAM-dependent methyltransferase
MPLRFLNSPAQVEAIVARFGSATEPTAATSYATVRDYCDSLDHLPQITGIDGDLKNVQRPWAVKAVLAQIPPPARVLEFGGGEPIVSGFLAELGYDVTLVDPYDGSGKGPIDYELFCNQFPHVKLIRGYFRAGLPGLVPQSIDVILSVSVLEHLWGESLTACFEAIKQFLKPGGVSVHCFDFIAQGNGDRHDFAQAQEILAQQSRLSGTAEPEPFPEFVERLQSDLETFFLPAVGHHQWRGGMPYVDFPFRKVASVQTIARLPRP